MKELEPSAEKIDPELEAAISHGLQATMDYLNSGIVRQSIAGKLAELNNTSLPIKSEPSIENSYTKVEANALAGYFMVPIWHNAKAWSDSHPGKLRIRDEHGKKKIEDLADVRDKFSNQPRDLLVNLFDHSFETLKIQIDEYGKKISTAHEKLVKDKVPYETWPAEIRNGARYAKILPQSDVRVKMFDGSPRLQLKAGFGAAQIVSWAVLGSIPIEYEKKHGRPISPEELETYIAKGKTFAMYLASQHIEIFRVLIREILTPQTSEEGVDVGITPFLRNVTFQSEGKFPFEVDRDALRRVVDKCKYIPTEGRTGCPAIIARDGQQNLVSALYDWNTQLAKDYYFPTLKLEE